MFNGYGYFYVRLYCTCLGAEVLLQPSSAAEETIGFSDKSFQLLQGFRVVAVVQPRFFSHFREVQQYFSELGLPKGMLEILPGSGTSCCARWMCLQFTGSSAMFRGLVSKAYDLGWFAAQVCVLSSGFREVQQYFSELGLRAWWRYRLVSLRQLLRKVDCVPQSWKLFGIFLSPSTT